MKKLISIMLAGTMLMLTACTSTPAPSGSSTPAGTSASAAAPEAPKENAEIVDGRFVDTRKITVEIYDRANDGGSKPEDNFYTDYIKAGMLKDHNVEVTFKAVPRWTEVEQLNNLLASGDAPDVCVTYSYPTIQTYANMGGVLDLAPHLEENKALLGNLWSLLGENNIYWDKDPEKGTIWAVEALLFHNKRLNTFVREDWLNKLNIKEPTTMAEFETMLKAFKDNADKLLGADAAKIIPFSISFDVGYRADHMLLSYVPDNFSEKDAYINGFDDRHLLYPGYKDGVKKLNEWYNAGLIWKDFPLYGAGDTTEDNMLKSGYVGSFIHNFDYPYRNGEDSIHANLKRTAGEDAGFIAVEPFPNDAGKYVKFLSGPIDRKVFLPGTNKEPLASLLYLDWISDLENRKFIQIGEEGVTHEVMADGAIKTLAATDDKIMNSVNNIDYTITINGLDLGDAEKNVKSVALGYAGVDARYIEKAYALSSKDARYSTNINVGEIKSQEGQDTPLKEKRDAMLNQAVVAPADKFDGIFDSGLKDYLSSGGQAIIDERKAAYEKYYK